MKIIYIYISFMTTFQVFIDTVFHILCTILECMQIELIAFYIAQKKGTNIW